MAQMLNEGQLIDAVAHTFGPGINQDALRMKCHRFPPFYALG